VLARLLLLRRRNHARRDERQRKKERKMESHSGGSGRSPMTSSYLSIHPSSPALQCTALHCWRVQWPGAHARHRERRLPRGAVPTHNPPHPCVRVCSCAAHACLFVSRALRTAPHLVVCCTARPLIRRSWIRSSNNSSAGLKKISRGRSQQANIIIIYRLIIVRWITSQFLDNSSQ
jgi:hypothetical protein